MFTNGDTVSYKYDGNGNLVQRSQNGGVTWDFVYDSAGTLVGSARDDVYWSKYKYDAAGRLTALMRSADGQNRYTGFAYNKFGQAANVKITGGGAEINEENTFDALGRLTKKEVDARRREYNLLKASTNTRTQADGASVYIRALNSNNHNVLVENEMEEIITFLTKVTKQGLRNLARNYGWY